MAADVLISVLISLGAFLMAWGMYYLKSRENMALIERGINPRQNVSQPRPFINLKYGLLLLGSGLGLLAAILLDGMIDHKRITPEGTVYYSDDPAIYFALIAIGGGLGLVISYLIEKKHWLDKQKNTD